MFSVHTTLEQLENDGFTLKTHQLLFVQTTTVKFKNASFISHFVFVFGKLLQRNLMISAMSPFLTSSVFRMCLVCTVRNANPAFLNGL